MTTSDEAGGVEEKGVDGLAALAERSRGGRLTPEEEKEAAKLATASLLDGKTGIVAAVDALVVLPWIIGVDAVTAAWPELKPAGRKQFLAALTSHGSDQAHRVRLSLGRGVFGVDPELSFKLLLDVCQEMRTAGEGKLQPKDRAIFFQVLVGKAKPWLLRIPVAQLPAEEGDALAHTALEVAFFGPCPAPTQEAVLGWVASAGRLGALPEPVVAAVAKAVERWQPKLRTAFKSKLTPETELPAALVEALAAPEPEPAKPAQEPRAKREPAEKPDEQAKPRGERPEKAPAQSREKQAFDLASTLRQIEAHVQSLRGELNQAKTALRQREPRPAREPRERPARGQAPAGELDPEELQRHNRQLEETVQELRQQLEDLASHHEDVAESMTSHDNPVDQLKQLLSLKLRQDYDDFRQLAQEPPDEVFREHYRILIDNVFSILSQQGIDPSKR